MALPPGPQDAHGMDAGKWRSAGSLQTSKKPSPFAPAIT